MARAVNELSDDGLTTQIREAYDRSAGAWASGPSAVYRQLADELVALETARLVGQRVLDLGAGTGVASEALTAIGARPIGLDLAVQMLAHRQEARPPGVAGDAQSLPFGHGVFDAVVAAFSLNHVPDLARSLGECRRVLRPRGLLLASTFPSGADHPAEAVVEGVLERYGYRRPSWYGTFKTRISELTGDPGSFGRTARDVGFAEVRVHELEVEAGLDEPRRAADWRLNMPHTLAFVSTLEPATRARLHDETCRALGEGLPSSLPMLVLSAQVT